MVIVFIFTALSILICIGTLQLIIFHIYLNIKGVSTYEWIQKRRSDKIFAETGSYPTDDSHLEGAVPPTNYGDTPLTSRH